jgi:hypothetical protein
MLKAGSAQACRNQISLNLKRTVGAGIYCTPHLKTALSGYTKNVNINGKNYCLVFQCRVNPKKTHICLSPQDYWVVNDPKDIRPYGILLIKDTVKASYPAVNVQFPNQ